MGHRFVASLVLLLPMITNSVSAAENAASTVQVRTWKDATGRFSLEAELVSLEENVVTLKKADGATLKVPLEKLSRQDQQYVEEARPVPTANPFTSATPQPSEAPDLQSTPASNAEGQELTKVLAEGVGTTADEALKDAFRNAVRQVVGAVVDADTLIENDEVIEDKVLTYSGGFVKKYEELPGSKNQRSGLHRVKITAQVERCNVVARLKAANVTVKDIDGASMFAEVVTQLDAEKGIVELLEKAFEGFPQNCLTASVVGKPELVEKDDARATVRIQVQVEPDMKAYKAFVERLQPVLEKVAADKGEFTATFKSVATDDAPQTYFTRDDPTSWSHWMPKSFRGENAWATLAIAVHRSKAGDRIEYRYYLLDKNVQPVLDAISWRCGQGKLSLLDSDEEIVAIDRFVLAQGAYGGQFLGSLITGGQINGVFMTLMSWNMGGQYRSHLDFANGKMIFMVSPVFFKQEHTQIPALTITRNIALTLDELKSVHSANCEIHFEQLDPDKR